MTSRSTLTAFNRQIRQLGTAIQERECGLIEIGRTHARNFDAGHSPSGGGVERVLAQLRRIVQSEEREAAKTRTPQPPTAPVNDLDALRARRAARTADQ